MTFNIKTFWKIIWHIILLVALFTYSYLIQRELLVADNKGKVTIVATGQTVNGTTHYLQDIGRMTINGRSLDTQRISKSDWLTQDANVVNVTHEISKSGRMTIDYPYAIKNISFEYKRGRTTGMLQILIDDQLVREIKTNNKKAKTDFATILTPQSLGVDSQNILWYSILTLFVISSFIFAKNELYQSISRKQIAIFILLSFLALFSLQMALDYLYSNSISLFNSDILGTELLILIFLTLFFIGISVRSLRFALPQKIKSVIRLPYQLVYLLPPFLAFYLMENAYSSLNILEGDILWPNFFILTAIYLALAWITTSLKIGGSLFLIIATSFGILNKIMIDTRNQPLLFYHLFQFRDGLNVAGETTLTLNNGILQSIFLAWTAIAILLFLPKLSYQLPSFVQTGIDKVGNWIRPLVAKLPKLVRNKYFARLSFSLSGILMSYLLLPTTIISIAKTADVELNLWRMQATYAKSGTPLAMASFYVNSIIQKPDHYSADKVREILDPYKVEDKDKQAPNLIVIQSESQADLSHLSQLKLSEDPLSFQHSLKDNTIHGSLNVSVFGGGTANTEYEVLTSNALALLPQNTFPYQQLINQPRNSLASLLNTHGYQSLAMHPQSGLNYNRKSVYEELGFDNSYFLDSKPSISKLYRTKMERGFVSDHALFQGVQNLYKKKKDKTPLFSFVVTMQGHGGYSGDSYTDPLSINGSTTEYPAESEFFTSLRSSDKAFEELVTFFRDYEEPTIIIMYGDHQPSLTEHFYKTLMPSNQDNPADLSTTYTTPFVIWANFNIPEQTGQTISPNFLLPYTMKLLKDSSNPLPSSAYHQFLSEVQAEVPVMTTWGYKTKDKKFHAKLDKHSLLDDYRILEYNNAIDQNTLDQYFK